MNEEMHRVTNRYEQWRCDIPLLYYKAAVMSQQCQHNHKLQYYNKAINMPCKQSGISGHHLSWFEKRERKKKYRENKKNVKKKWKKLYVAFIKWV